ncbi:hypothetical protein M0R45_031033 [Rubus argutus]|uniref:Uncharacterized protein n=1 Tax=Rubus argutus TaxID=59490 RepID=A0AAW1WDJ3_RUBAR
MYKKLLCKFQWAASASLIMVADKEELHFLRDKIMNKGLEVSQINFSTSADEEILVQCRSQIQYNHHCPAMAVLELSASHHHDIIKFRIDVDTHLHATAHQTCNFIAQFTATTQQLVPVPSHPWPLRRGAQT